MLSSTFDVLTLGAATRDIFVTSQRFENIPSDHAPDGFNACLPLGAKLPVDELVFASGGGATNAAVTCSRFGLKTGCITRVGNDLGGREIVAELKREKINVARVQIDSKHRTAYSIILIAGAGSRAILVARGASAHLERRAIPWHRLSLRWLYLTSVAGNLTLLRDVFAHIKHSRVKLAWNPGNLEIEHGLKRLKPYLIQTDILILNTGEAAELADCPPRDLKCMLRVLGPLPRGVLIITDGARGAYAHARGLTWHASALTGKLVNTTGAGDAFGSAFTAAMFKRGEIPTALQAGTLNAFSVATHMGAHTGILHKFPSIRDLARAKIKKVSLV